MKETHKCKWCGSGNCDAVVPCDVCFKDISEEEPIYFYDPNDFEADDEGYIRICKKCEFDLTLQSISI